MLVNVAMSRSHITVYIVADVLSMGARRKKSSFPPTDSAGMSSLIVTNESLLSLHRSPPDRLLVIWNSGFNSPLLNVYASKAVFYTALQIYNGAHR